jgi:uncharacterized protein DUF669
MAKATRSKKRRRPVEDDEDVAPRRRRSRNGGGSGGSFKVDFRDAQSGGARRFPEADYKVKIAKAERSKSQQGNSQIKVTYEFIEPEKYEGKTLVDYLTLTRKAAWRIGNLFDAVGIKWSQKVMEFKTSKLIGKELGITLADDTYNGRVRSKVADYLDLETINSILSGEDVDEDEDEDEDADDLEEQLDDMDRAELKEYIKDEGLDIKVKKSMSDEDLRAAILEAAEEEDEDEDDDDDEDEDLEEFDDDDL